ncbi:MerR family transcriptional regulator [Streptomyces sp. NPDC050560]|uniref:MerR family transcriptional regulator n=1 Tax=Streptomyces sp. NPDC050560 TaxID=3365630 RepID=UPI0037B1BB9A
MASGMVTIGEFARMTHLSAKALRFYQREGVLAPADVDPANGYRRYRPEQAVTAQVIRRLRALDMSVEQIRTVLAAPSADERNRLVAEHLAAMERRLAQTREAVDSLRALLGGEPWDIPVEHRSVAAFPALAITAEIPVTDLDAWWPEAFRELDTVLRGADGLRAAGPRGGLYSTALFAEGRGELTVYRPVAASQPRPPAPPGRAEVRTVPAAELAVAVHRGEDIDIDRVYGALGGYVCERAIGVPGPVRETYLDADTDSPTAHTVTEIGWPIFTTAPAPPPGAPR